MTGISPAAIALLAASFGVPGLPLGLPPQPENPAMAYVAPDECLFYASWASMAAADPQSKNHTEQLLAEEDVRRFAATVERAIALSFRNGGPAPRGVPRAEPREDLVPLAVRTLVTRSTAIFIEDLEATTRQLAIRGGILVDAGDQASEIVDSLAEFLSGGQLVAEPISLGRVTGHRFPAGEDGLPIELSMASAGPYVLFGIGEQSLEGMVKRLAAKKTPLWHTEIGKRLPVERRASLYYVNAPVLLDKFPPLGGPVKQQEFTVGLKQVGEIIGVVGLDEEGIVSRSLVKLNGPPTGFVKLFGGDGVDAKNLEFLPRDALFATAFTLDAKAAFDLLQETISESSPEGDQVWERMNADLENLFKLKLRDEVLAAFGDVWTVSASSVDGWMGTVATVEVKDPETVNAAIHSLIRRADHRPMETIKYGEYEIYSPVGPNDLLRPAWCVTEKRLIVGLSAQAVKGMLSTTEEEHGLFNDPKLSPSLEGDGKIISVGYQDTAKVFESIYSVLPVALRAFQRELRGPYGYGQFDALSWLTHYLPPARTIHRHLKPSLSVTRLTKDGLETTSHSTAPLPNIGASAPLAAALLVPAVQASRAASRRAQSSNNLKQILLAIHNYHDTYNRLPPAYRFEKDKKPGLSWRVLILPFIEQQTLYEQFHLDEPWDSEHNKKLIAKMPKIYRSPASKAEEGKTVYLGVSGERGIFPPPKPPASDRESAQMGSINFAAVTDGTSNTIAVVEAGDESAVIWTKPDDYTPDPENPFKGLLGLHPVGFHVGLMDGSIRFISDKLDPTMLMRMFQRDDGNPIDFE